MTYTRTHETWHFFQTSVELRIRFVAEIFDGGGKIGLLFSTRDTDIVDVNFFNFSISFGDKLNGEDELAWWSKLFISVNDKDRVE